MDDRIIRLLLCALCASGAIACRDKVARSLVAPPVSSPVPLPVLPTAHPSPTVVQPKVKPLPAPTIPDDDALPEASAGLPIARQAVQVVGGKERVVDGNAARDRGLTLVDLSDDFAPFIFHDGKAADGALLPNRYRDVFIGLANNRTDGDGEPLPPGERNYLELYGVPPSLSVLRQRFLEDSARSCERTIDLAALLAVDSIETWGRSTEKKESAKHHLRALRLAVAQKKVDAATLDELLAKDPRYLGDVKAHRRVEAERAAFAEVEKRLVCEGLLDVGKHTSGTYDGPMRNATLDFQQKNAVFAQADLTRGTLEALARPLLQNDFLALRRVLAERAAHAGGIIEDGSASDFPQKPGHPREQPTYKSKTGAELPVPNLVGQAVDALLLRLGLATPEDALAFFRRHSADDFRSMRVAVRFPSLPEYYGPHMDLVAEIDRGDIWYDFPFDEKGMRRPQPREHYPSFTLFVRWRGEKVPLVSWRTTIGGWRSEVASDGEEYYRYKDSDVGPRVWRHIVAAPVWLPPTSSPLGAMVKTKWVAGAYPHVVNYDETGPGYLSAYGLVAGIHEQVRKRDGQTAYFDNGIRTHGSFDYLSLRGRFSHGCHRLYNNLAVRLFSFVLGHRRAKVLGPMALGFRRTFYLDGEVYDMRLPTRGFYFELDPPLPIETLKGTLKGKLAQPVSGYVPKPGARSQPKKLPAAPNGPEGKAGGGQ